MVSGRSLPEINGVQHYLWRAVDQHGAVIEISSNPSGPLCSEAVLPKVIGNQSSPPRVITTDTGFKSVPSGKYCLSKPLVFSLVPRGQSFEDHKNRLQTELTLPKISHTIILTRAEGRTPVPEKDKLEELAKHGAALALFLNITLLKKVAATVSVSYGGDCSVAVVHKTSWPDQIIVSGRLTDIYEKVREVRFSSTAMILVGRVLDCSDFANSRLYDPEFTHRFRRATVTEVSADEH